MPIDTIVNHLAEDNAYLLVLTGAGISLASGIPTFRGPDPDAVWSKDTTEKGTRRYFQRDPVGSWKWYLPRFDMCKPVKPNAGHFAVTEIEGKLHRTGRRCLTMTQNVDGLHLAAGTANLIEIHGAARKMRCSSRTCSNGEPRGFLPWDDTLFAPFRADPSMTTLPRCPKCRKPIRAHVLWFDESYFSHEDYGIRRFDEQEEHLTCVLIVGTSFSVGITDMVVNLARSWNLPAFIVDPNMTEPPEGAEGFTLIRETSETFLPRLAAAL